MAQTRIKAKQMKSKSITPAHIASMMTRVSVHTSTAYFPTPHVTATAWLDGSFHLGVAISKAIDPKNFNELLGIERATAEVMAAAEKKLWELEGYRAYSE